MVYSWVDSTSLLLIGQNMWDTNRFFCACEGQYLRHSALSIERNLARGYSCCSCCVLCGAKNPYFPGKSIWTFPVGIQCGWVLEESTRNWAGLTMRNPRRKAGRKPTLGEAVPLQRLGDVSVSRCVGVSQTFQPRNRWSAGPFWVAKYPIWGTFPAKSPWLYRIK